MVLMSKSKYEKQFSNKRKYKAGIIGCGRMAGGFESISTVHPCTHVGAYKEFPNIEVVAVSDNNEDKLRKFAEYWRIKKPYLYYKVMLEKEGLDIVSVCVPDKYHAEVVIEAAKHKPKAIFCEKVMATTLEEAEEMVKVCKENNVKLIIDYTRRFDPVYRKIKELIDNGEIGEPLFIYGSHISGLAVMGTHIIDLFRFLFGEVKKVYGTKEKKALNAMDERYSENYSPKDKPYSGLFEFENGAIGFLAGTSRRDHEFFEIDIHGTKGRIIFNDTNVIYGEEDKVLLFKKDNIGTILKKVPFPKVQPKNLMVCAINEVLACIEKNRDNICSGYDGLKTIELMEKLKQEV